MTGTEVYRCHLELVDLFNNEVIEQVYYFRAQNENIQKNMNMSRKLALNLARVYKNKHAKKTPLSHIMFDCLMEPHHLLTVPAKTSVP